MYRVIDDLKDFEQHGMRVSKLVVGYEEEFREKNSRDIRKGEDLIKIGEYSGITLINNESCWVKFIITGEDICEVNIFINMNDIYLSKDDVLLSDEYHELVENILKQFCGEDIGLKFEYKS